MKSVPALGCMLLVGLTSLSVVSSYAIGDEIKMKAYESRSILSDQMGTDRRPIKNEKLKLLLSKSNSEAGYSSSDIKVEKLEVTTNSEGEFTLLARYLDWSVSIYLMPGDKGFGDFDMPNYKVRQNGMVCRTRK